MSFIPVSPDSDFPIQNLPYGVFSTVDNVGFIAIWFHCRMQFATLPFSEWSTNTSNFV